MRATRVGRGGVTLLVGATTVVVVVSAILAVTIRREPPSPNRRLAEAVGAHRVTRARLTGGFAYAPCDTSPSPNESLISGLACRHPESETPAHPQRLAAFAVELRALAPAAGSKAAFGHASGLWNVVWGKPGSAIEHLQTAAQVEPANARTQSDLAAAFLQRAEFEQDPLFVLDAYAANDSALKLDPRLVEALFNRALILERLHLGDLAARQWDTYLQVDDETPWADEARDRLAWLRAAPLKRKAALDQLTSALTTRDDSTVLAVARRFPRAVRQEARSGVLGWARTYGIRPAASDSLLRYAEVLSRAVDRGSGDALLADVVSSIQDAAERGEGWRIEAIARGIAAYDKGHRLLDAFQFDSASVLLAQADRALRTTGNAARYWVAQDSATLVYQRAGSRGYDAALSLLDKIRRDAPTNYKTTRGLAARGVGLIHAIRADYEAAISAYEAAIREGRGTGDPGLELRPRGVLASIFAEMRGAKDAWRELYAAFRLLDAYPEEAGVAQRLFVTAAELSWKRTPSISLLFQEEAVRLARLVDGQGTMTITALAKQAELLARLQLMHRALTSLHEARAAADLIPNDSIRAITRADVDLVEGEVWLHARPDSALRILGRVVDRYRQSQYLLEMDRAQLLLANAHVSSGNADAARAAFEASLSETERRRAGIGNTDDRARFLDHARPVIDRVLGFLVDRADTVGAAEFFEHMRARVLLDRVRTRSMRHDSAASLAPIAQLRRAVPRGTTVITYAVMDTVLISWLIRADTVAMHVTPLVASIDRSVARFSALIEAGASEAEIRPIAAQLHQLLIAPWRGSFANDARLVIVPDKWLHFVPFGALFDESAQLFLAETNEITVAPSMALYAASAVRYAKLRGGASRVLAVGNPSFDTKVFQLPRLPGAEREATRIAQDYDDGRVLIGPAATKQAFLHEAASSDIVHFAGYGVVTPESPLLSHLLFAPEADNGSSGVLYARELFDAVMPRTRLAILSGCHTAAGQLSDTEGVSSLARALFGSGVPAIVASLWAVDDAQTADFFGLYHGFVSRGADPVAALRRTQRQWIADHGDRWGSLAIWGAFQFFGATSE